MQNFYRIITNKKTNHKEQNEKNWSLCFDGNCGDGKYR